MDSHASHRLTSSLQRLAATGADTAKVTAAIVSAWSEVEAALVPVIGPRGMAALFERSLHNCRKGHPWLAAVPENLEAQMDLPALAAVLSRQDSANAAAGGGAHLKHCMSCWADS